MSTKNSNSLEDLEKIIKNLESFIPEGRRANFSQLDFFYSRLENDVKKLEEVFNKEYNSLVDSNGNIKSYPKEVRKAHNRIGIALGSLFTLGGLIGVSLALGGTNILAWSRFLVLIGFGTGAALGAAVATPIKVALKKTFKINDPNLRGTEKRAVKRYRERLTNAQTILNDMAMYTNEIVTGKYQFKNKRTVTKEKRGFRGKRRTVNKEVTELQKKFKYLPLRSKRKLNKIIQDINYDYQGLMDNGITVIRPHFESGVSAYKDEYTKAMELTNEILSARRINKETLKEKQTKLEGHISNLKKLSTLYDASSTLSQYTTDADLEKFVKAYEKVLKELPRENLKEAIQTLKQKMEKRAKREASVNNSATEVKEEKEKQSVTKTR